MDNLVWGIPFLLFLLLCPLMMVGMGLFFWFAARLGFRRSGSGAAAGEGGHSGHMMCGPMMMGHDQTGARPGGSHDHSSHQPSPEDEVSALRERVESLERQLAETWGAGGPEGRSLTTH